MPITKRDNFGRIATGSNKQHGLSNDPIYDCWIAMKARCYNFKNPVYELYGGRGIEVCKSWRHSFISFIKDMGASYKRGLTLERINNNGNYEPENCQWITIQEQQKNKCNSNQVPGVHYEKSRKKWHTDITRNGVKYFLGRFESLDEAREARIRAERKLIYK